MLILKKGKKYSQKNTPISQMVLARPWDVGALWHVLLDFFVYVFVL